MNFMRNTWYAAVWAQDLPADRLVPVTIIGEAVVLFRDAAGKATALLDRCPHRLVPLHLGRLCDGGARLQCGYHGLEFDGAGRCVRNPHSDRVPTAAKVRAFPVVERHSLIWVWMGDAAPCEAQIPDYSAFDECNNARVGRRETIELDVNYQLMTDNLLDLSHVSFLHDGILGHADMVRGNIEVQQEDNTLYVRRATPNVAPPGMFDLMFRRDGQPVDVWADMRWNAPASMLNYAGVCPPGGERSAGVHILGAHILTPVSEFRTRYHVAAVRYDDTVTRSEEEASEVMQKLGDLRRHAFKDQDEPMVMAQQDAMIRAGGLDAVEPLLLNIDVGPARARRLLETLRQQADEVREPVEA
ncbi:aromatic ring-hydroxylating dioxygenase subunit alpha [Chitinasiproducens palmae]|uniref:Vanillate O-demethylase monooxygenase subunit n=1 Tax=Chitinasiproducens palmae TaxID=1770053 RepID=A0A1H2PMK8_9BURK|nr:aromatic ring-hydroxylating dioxygenase subunit alpha [Chitinasiproducens palmae]SDV47345.1 vanillate O-demethylase monooxygenase subunit [Chitinasiproducens palmae]